MSVYANNKWFIAVIFILFLNSDLCAKLYSELNFEHISIKEGLSQVTVYDIYQDSEGFLWFGTQDGLNRYDGYQLKIYRNHPFDKNSLSHNWVYSISEDKNGNLIIGTRSGLNIYRRDLDRFELFRHDSQEQTSIANQDIQNLCTDSDDSFWFNTSQGLYHYNPADSVLARYNWGLDDENSVKGDEINFIFLDRDYNLWFGTNLGLNKYNRNLNTFRYFPRLKKFAEDRINNISQDKEGRLWLGAEGKLLCFDPEFEQFRTDLQKSIPKTSINAVLNDQNGQMWLGTSDGLYQLDPVTGNIKNHRSDASMPNSLSYNTVFSLFQDRSGLIWVGTYGGGVNKLNTHKHHFTNIRKSVEGMNGLQNDFVYAFSQDVNGKIWIGTDDGLDVLNFGTGQVSHFHHDKYPDLRLIRSIMRDTKGLLWVGTSGNGLFTIDDRDDKNVKIQQFRYNPIITDGISSDYIMCLLEDRDNNVWVGTTRGLCVLSPENRESRSFRIYNKSSLAPSGLPENHIRALFEDRNGKLWIGTYGGGLAVYDRKSGKFNVYRYDPDNPVSLSSNYIYSILEDHHGAIWVGTYGGGLNRFEPNNSEKVNIQHFYTEDGLPGNLIYGLLEDNQGNIWISTNNGLAKCTFDPAKDNSNENKAVFRVYDASDGIQDNEFNFGAYKKIQKDLFLFGGVSGLTYFHPDSIVDKHFTPPVTITDFKIFNRSVLVDADSSLRVNITRTKNIELLYRQNVFTFEFAALDYTAPMKNKYAYRMDGFDQEWTSASAKMRSVTYTNLDPGKYIFRLKGTNSDGVWNPDERTITVNIKPPFWLAWWFRSLWVATIIGLFLLVYKLRIRRIKKQKQILEQQVYERTRELSQKTHQLEITNEELESFAYSVSHDLRSPLRAISGFSHMVIEDSAEITKNKTIHEYLLRIQNGAHQMAELIDAVLKLSRLTRGSLNYVNVNLSSLAEKAITSLQESDPGRKVKIAIEPGLDACGDEVLLRTMLENLLGNAWKFSAKSRQAKIMFGKKNTENQTDSEEVFFVQDNGVGFDMQYIDRLFQPFQRLHVEKEFPGTGIGLATVKRIVNRHGGRIWVESTPNKRTIFYFTLPNRHLT